MVESWLEYKHEDGTYSVTPNYLPHALRCGYESYSHVNCYNNLAMVGMAVTERIFAGGLRETLGQRSGVLPARNQYADPTSGYAFMRDRDCFFAVSLRMHEGRYTPALCGFHFRFGEIKLPLAEPKFNGEQPAGEYCKQADFPGVWEGFILHEEEGSLHVPDIAENAAVHLLGDGLEMSLDTPNWHCRKKICLASDGFVWEYRLWVKRDFAVCEHIMPLLLHDGHNELRLRRRNGHHYDFSFAGKSFALCCDNEHRGSFPRESTHSRYNQLSLDRSFHSVSGVSAPLSLKIAERMYAGDAIFWRVCLKVQ